MWGQTAAPSRVKFIKGHLSPHGPLGNTSQRPGPQGAAHAASEATLAEWPWSHSGPFSAPIIPLQTVMYKQQPLSSLPANIWSCQANVNRKEILPCIRNDNRALQPSKAKAVNCVPCILYRLNLESTLVYLFDQDFQQGLRQKRISCFTLSYNPIPKGLLSGFQWISNQRVSLDFYTSVLN